MSTLGDLHRSLGEIPKPGRDPLSGARHRRRQHHQLGHLSNISDLTTSCSSSSSSSSSSWLPSLSSRGLTASGWAACCGRVPTRPRATRTVAVDTPVRAAILLNVDPAASAATICARNCAVSLLGRFGPDCSGTSAATPLSAKAPTHRHSVVSLTPNPDATSLAEAIFVVTSCTAANRRPARSEQAKVKLTSPNTNTTPPSGPSSSPTDGPIERACACSKGNTG